MIFFSAKIFFTEQSDCAHKSAMKIAVKTLPEFIKIWDIEKLKQADPSAEIGLPKILKNCSVFKA